jgi:sugar phosphate isomerase/epimerase
MAKHLIGCTLWSLAIPDTVEAIEQAAAMGFEGIQLTFLKDDDLSEGGLGRIRDAIARTGLKVPGGMVGFVGEDWQSIASIRRTGGFLDPSIFPERLDRCRRWSEAHARLGIRHITVHVGFVPEPKDPRYAEVLDRVAQAADAFHGAGLTMGLETGQESGKVLAKVLKDLGRDYVSINFDPANFILYGSDDPVRAAKSLARHVSMAHMKDGIPSAKPGEVWGEDVPLGTGKVDFSAVLRALEKGGFTGPLIIEREAGSNRVADIAAAKRYLEDLLPRL